MSPEWGAPDRYYSGSKPGAWERRSPRLEKELERAVPGIRRTVEEACKRWNSPIREVLRSEMALRLTFDGQTRAVPVKVVEGMPAPFADEIEQFKGLEWLILSRATLVALIAGARFLEEHVARARERWGDQAGPASPEEAARVRETAEIWLRKLDELKVLKQIIDIREDVLGAYYFRVPEIHIYWVVIGTIAQALGVSPEALTIVVLAHELAHAYTHLGYDIGGDQWKTDDFAKCDAHIVEGLAQFYAETVCRRVQERAPAALHAYEKLLDCQSGPYHAHREWGPQDGKAAETVRASILVCRARGVVAPEELKEVMAFIQKEISRKKSLLDLPREGQH